MEWFEKVFLPSLHEKKKTVHGKISTLLSQKQADICGRYMKSRICGGDYGQFEIYEYSFNGKKIQLCESGKYNILYW